jgi:hypothetical protein
LSQLYGIPLLFRIISIDCHSYGNTSIISPDDASRITWVVALPVTSTCHLASYLSIYIEEDDHGLAHKSHTPDYQHARNACKRPCADYGIQLLKVAIIPPLFRPISTKLLLRFGSGIANQNEKNHKYHQAAAELYFASSDWLLFFGMRIALHVRCIPFFFFVQARRTLELSGEGGGCD